MELLFYAAGYFMQSVREPVYSMMVITWFLPTIILSTGYRAILFSLLTVPHYTNLVDNVEQLKQSPDIAVYVIKSASVEELFLVS